MTRKLTPSARNTASKLSISDLRWIIDDLPERYVSQLFNEKGREPDAIHFEIERLNDLPKDSRIPWQSELNYQLSKYGIYIKIAVIAIVILILARIIIPMFRKKPQTVLQTQPQVIIMPPQVQQPQPFILTKKYDVKLIISPDFVSEARNTQWDMTQTLTPANDKDGNYIFSAKLDNLDNFSRWANRHKDSIKFIEPEELRQLINNI